MNGMRRSVVVVVVSYFSSQMLVTMLSSLLPDPAVSKVIVVDNSENIDEYRNLVASTASFECVECFAAPYNGGFGYGINLGIDYANTILDSIDGFVFVNPDVVCVTPNLAGNLIEFCQGSSDSTPGVIASPVITFRTPGDLTERVWFAGGSVDLRSWAVHHVDYGSSAREVLASRGSSLGTEYVSGACLAMLTATLRTIGRFDESLFMYWEDVEYALRAKRSGVGMIVVSSCIVRHEEGGTSASEGDVRSSLYYYYMARNRVILSTRYGGSFFFSLRWWVDSLKSVVRPYRHEEVGQCAKTRAAMRGFRSGILWSFRSFHRYLSLSAAETRTDRTSFSLTKFTIPSSAVLRTTSLTQQRFQRSDSRDDNRTPTSDHVRPDWAVTAPSRNLRLALKSSIDSRAETAPCVSPGANTKPH